MRIQRLLIAAACAAACNVSLKSWSTAQSAQIVSSDAAPASFAQVSTTLLLPEPAKGVPAEAIGGRLSFAPMVKKVMGAAVRIHVFCRPPGCQMPQKRPVQAQGSGFIVRGDGVIVTSSQIISGPDIHVILADGRDFPARVLLADVNVTVLKIDWRGEALATLALDDRDDSQVGDLVLAIGSPFDLGETFSLGIVSATERSVAGADAKTRYIQTDAAINPGNAGGPLVNMNGDVAGMMMVLVAPAQQSSGVSLAVPASQVKRVVLQALSEQANAGAVTH